MRLVLFLGCLALTATGCHGVGLSRYSSAACPKPGEGGGAACVPGDGSNGNSSRGGANGQASTPGNQLSYQDGFQQGFRQGCQTFNQPGSAPCRDVKSPTVRELRGPDPEVSAPPPKPTAAAIAPDILLIPKTVLVPYAAHTPTGPMRMAGVTPAGAFCPPEERVHTPAPAATAPAPDNRILDALDQSLQQMKLLNQRVAELETRTVRQAPVPAPCPPGTTVRPYCPPVAGSPVPNVEYPPPGYIPLPPPRTLPSGTVPMIPPSPPQTSGEE